MAWSTRQLADLAGTTVKAVRHYHEIGLLELPERASNGYKQYGVAHLVRVLQITRLSALGVPLSQVATMGRADQDPDEAIRVLDAELAASIERLQRVRAELARDPAAPCPGRRPGGVQRRVRGPVRRRPQDADDLPAASSTSAGPPTCASSWRRSRGPGRRRVRPAAPDADDATRDRVAEGLAPAVRRQLERHARLTDFGSYASGSPDVAQSTVVQAMGELYNPAQLDVLYRTHLLTREDS